MTYLGCCEPDMMLPSIIEASLFDTDKVHSDASRCVGRLET